MLCLLFLAGILACKKNKLQPLPFQETPLLYPVTAGVIDEASGMADSYANPGFLWVIQDSQQPTALYLLNHNGQHGKKIFIKNVTNRDWEELAISGGPNSQKNYVYIAETGDNNHAYTDYAFYRFEEPLAAIDTISQVDKIVFKYPDGSHDAEAFFVDAATKDIYIITKRDAYSTVYKLSYPQSLTSTNTASYVMSLPYTGVVAASYSGATKELLVKTYGKIYYYQQAGNQSIVEAMKTSYIGLPYVQEPQGEAISFSNDGGGFYTLSEKAFAPSVSLSYYKRL